MSAAAFPKRPGEDRQPSAHAGIRGQIHDYVFRDALPVNLRGVWDLRFVNNVDEHQVAEELRVHVSFVRWAVRVLQHRFDAYAHMIRNNDINRHGAPMTREEAARVANAPGQVSPIGSFRG